MEEIITWELEEQEKQAIIALIEACNRDDGTCYGTELDADCYYMIWEGGNLVSVLEAYELGETRNGKNMLEITGFTESHSRKKHLFETALKGLKEEYPECVWKIMVKESWNGSLCSSASETLKALRAEFLYEERMLMCEIKEQPYGCEQDAETVLVMRKEGDRWIFQAKQGEVCLMEYTPSILYLYGVLVYDSWRSRGYGKRILEQLNRILWWDERFKSYQKIILQVSSENISACRLYESMGFKKTEGIHYYLLK